MRESRLEGRAKMVLETIENLAQEGKPEVAAPEVEAAVNELFPPRNRLSRQIRIIRGDVYTALHRLEDQEKIVARWEPGEYPRRRLYHKK
jgi:ABC-type hemin transport system substrate-binding protein